MDEYFSNKNSISLHHSPLTDYQRSNRRFATRQNHWQLFLIPDSSPIDRSSFLGREGGVWLRFKIFVNSNAPGPRRDAAHLGRNIVRAGYAVRNQPRPGTFSSFSRPPSSRSNGLIIRAGIIII